ncbi:amidophosphoribosyltransferase [Cyclobacteriaceae bacterium]|nr:amidophosphoribosyltransferase [Cyclobacteriaceae bacterium]
MSDAIKHECGIAMVRLLKPYSYYIEKYGTPLYAINKMYMLMEKQHNRGQDGAGIASIKLDVPQGTRYISRYRSIDKQPISDIFKKINKKFNKVLKQTPEHYNNADWLQENIAFTGEVFLGHLRYGTHGKNSIESCHPFLRQNNWRSKSLVVAGNFNMTNVDELFQRLVELGQHPKEKADTVTVLEKIGHFQDEESQRIFEKYKDDFTNNEVSKKIEEEMDMQDVLQRSCKDFDGGYAMCGITGYGASFVARDPAGIRPAYYYADDEVVVVASEKPAIKTAFGVEFDQIQEVLPGHALIIEKSGEFGMKPYIDQLEKKSCSFERIYFSRGTDPDIYRERKELGKLLVPEILEKVNYNLEDTVFSYIPNTAETSFLGMIEGVYEHLFEYRKNKLKDGNLTNQDIEALFKLRPRVEKLVIKDAKLRTFITDDDARDDLVSNVYDTTYEVIRKKVDTLVVIDDSIVRGTTLEKSIIKTLDRLEPKKIIIVSSAPQIRYPDCYGIDMSKMKEFIAFRALLLLLKEHNLEYKLDEVYELCNRSKITNEVSPNYVQELYSLFTDDQITNKIAEMIKSEGIGAEIEVVYQSVENLHKAIPNHLGDWYFTGDYPTKGGMKVVNKAFANFKEGKEVRAY